jgi:hypothetical protein
LDWFILERTREDAGTRRGDVRCAERESRGAGEQKSGSARLVCLAGAGECVLDLSYISFLFRLCAFRRCTLDCFRAASLPALISLSSFRYDADYILSGLQFVRHLPLQHPPSTETPTASPTTAFLREFFYQVCPFHQGTVPFPPTLPTHSPQLLFKRQQLRAVHRQ